MKTDINKDIFISYSRKDKEFVKDLCKKITDKGINTWIDWQDIPVSTFWWEEIQNAIASSNIFIIIVSNSSMQSEYCIKELDYAFYLHKKIIPVVIEKPYDKVTPNRLKSVNWLYWKGDENEKLDTLIETITTDYEWVKYHTFSLLRALKWRANTSDPSLLLRGIELSEAIDNFSRFEGKHPLPTALQNQFLLQSERERNKSVQVLILLLISWLLISVMVIGYALYNKTVVLKQAIAIEDSAASVFLLNKELEKKVVELDSEKRIKDKINLELEFALNQLNTTLKQKDKAITEVIRQKEISDSLAIVSMLEKEKAEENEKAAIAAKNNALSIFRAYEAIRKIEVGDLDAASFLITESFSYFLNSKESKISKTLFNAAILYNQKVNADFYESAHNIEGFCLYKEGVVVIDSYGRVIVLNESLSVEKIIKTNYSFKEFKIIEDMFIGITAGGDAVKIDLISGSYKNIHLYEETLKDLVVVSKKVVVFSYKGVYVLDMGLNKLEFIPIKEGEYYLSTVHHYYNSENEFVYSINNKIYKANIKGFFSSIMVYTNKENNITSLSYDPDKQEYYVGTETGVLVRLNKNFEEIKRYKSHGSGLTGVSSLLGGLVTASLDKRICFYDANSDLFCIEEGNWVLEMESIPEKSELIYIVYPNIIKKQNLDVKILLEK